MKRKLLPWIVAAALMATATSSVAAPSGIAAVVNGQAITTAQVSDLAMRMAGAGITDQLVGNALVDQEAKRRNVEVTPAEIDANIDAIRGHIKPQTLYDYLKGRNTSLDVFRNYLRVQIEVRKLLAGALKNTHNKVTDQELAGQAMKYVESLKDSGRVVLYLGGTASGPQGVAATVNGQDIKTSQVTALASMTAGPTALERLIINTLVDQEAAKQDVAESPAEIDARVAVIRNQIKPRILEDVLEQNHMSMDDLRELQRIQIEAEKLIAKKIPSFQMVHVRHILVAIDQPGAPKIPGIKPHSEAEAKEIMDQIQAQLAAGKSFEMLAQQYSEDTGSRAKGGDLGVITGKDPYDARFLNAAFALKKGEVTKTPVRTSFGLELIEAVSRGDDPLPLDERLYQRADQQAKKEETRAQMRGYIPALVARSKIAVYMPGVVVQSIGL